MTDTRALCTNSERSLSALWGKLAAEILMQNWDIALEELNRLKEIIDSKNFASPLNQVHSRIWLMHWSLFIFFNHDNGRTQIIDLFNQEKKALMKLPLIIVYCSFSLVNILGPFTHNRQCIGILTCTS
ncbi:eukaryotic translation initiation factor 3 subunit E-like isoform X2 [Gastrolobium bilobum]|uniref:eukaryotic translation initiation factor 3 subunit E-like isoform X2 n=1 Tax=Gastrolobium bilobum TaxID=150636 RepID=UPI002AAF9F4F|nr:eukaryotic translation initiation factor 3 subunit E-like isoform X2 [Gastrolobium bilobum]